MYQPVLSDLLARVNGARWAVIAGSDGVLLAASSHSVPSSAELLAAEFATLMRALEHVTDESRLGRLHTLTLSTTEGKVICHLLVDDYFLLLDLSLEGQAGRAQFEIARSRARLERSLFSEV